MISRPQRYRSRYMPQQIAKATCKFQRTTLGVGRPIRGENRSHARRRISPVWPFDRKRRFHVTSPLLGPAQKSKLSQPCPHGPALKSRFSRTSPTHPLLCIHGSQNFAALRHKLKATKHTANNYHRFRYKLVTKPNINPI